MSLWIKRRSWGADVICMSSFFVIGPINMKLSFDELKPRRNIRENYIVMIGGEAVTRTFAERDWSG